MRLANTSRQCDSSISTLFRITNTTESKVEFAAVASEDVCWQQLVSSLAQHGAADEAAHPLWPSQKHGQQRFGLLPVFLPGTAYVAAAKSLNCQCCCSC